MNPTPVIHNSSFERWRTQVSHHLERLGSGHDPWGHMFAIERLARARRAEWMTEHKTSLADPMRERGTDDDRG